MAVIKTALSEFCVMRRYQRDLPLKTCKLTPHFAYLSADTFLSSVLLIFIPFKSVVPLSYKIFGFVFSDSLV